MEIRSVGAALIHADKQAHRQRNMLNLIDAFRKYANAPKSWICISLKDTKNFQKIHRYHVSLHIRTGRWCAWNGNSPLKIYTTCAAFQRKKHHTVLQLWRIINMVETYTVSMPSPLIDPPIPKMSQTHLTNRVTCKEKSPTNSWKTFSCLLPLSEPVNLQQSAAMKSFLTLLHMTDQTAGRKRQLLLVSEIRNIQQSGVSPGVASLPKTLYTICVCAINDRKVWDSHKIEGKCSALLTFWTFSFSSVLKIQNVSQRFEIRTIYTLRLNNDARPLRK
jgi:hypothetical protein